jgi:hypothetical protein
MFEIFGFLFNKKKTNNKPKKHYLNINKLAKAIVITSSQIDKNKWWSIGKNSTKGKEKIKINEEIDIVITYAWTTDDWSAFGILHYLGFHFDICIKNICVRKYKLHKDLVNYNLYDSYYEIKNEDIIHQLKEEWIITINNWTNNICDNYENIKTFKEHEATINKEKKLEEERKKLYGNNYS